MPDQECRLKRFEAVKDLQAVPLILTERAFVNASQRIYQTELMLNDTLYHQERGCEDSSFKGEISKTTTIKPSFK